MPIQRKFKENMRRVKCARFVIRIWFGHFPMAPEKEKHQEEILVGFKDRLDRLPPNTTPDDALTFAEAFFDEHDGVAALEILSAATHNGVVSYYEWP